MSYDFNDALKKASEEFPSSGGNNSDSFNISEGSDNICRILSPNSFYATHFIGKGIRQPACYGYEKGCPVRRKEEDGTMTNVHADTSIKAVTYVLDRKDGKVKAAFLPYSVIKQIGILQENPDYKFSELPMPYDIRITFSEKAAPSEKYVVTVRPGGEDPTEDQMGQLSDEMAKGGSDKIAARIKEKQMETDEKAGRRLSPEAIKKEQEDYIKAALANQPEMPTVQLDSYPDEIDPKDIPF